MENKNFETELTEGTHNLFYIFFSGVYDMILVFFPTNYMIVSQITRNIFVKPPPQYQSEQLLVVTHWLWLWIV